MLGEINSPHDCEELWWVEPFVCVLAAKRGLCEEMEAAAVTWKVERDLRRGWNQQLEAQQQQQEQNAVERSRKASYEAGISAGAGENEVMRSATGQEGSRKIMASLQSPKDSQKTRQIPRIHKPTLFPGGP